MGKRVLATQVKKVVEKNLENSEKLELAEQEEVDRIVNQTEGVEADGTKKMNYIPFVVGGALVLYLISRKK